MTSIDRRQFLKIAASVAIVSSVGLVQIASAATTVQQGIVWRTVNGVSLDCNVISPGDGLVHPGIAYFHGGGFNKGDEDNSADLQAAAQIAASGFVVVTFDYREALPPSVGATEQMADAHAAIQWMRDNATIYKINPLKIGVFGESSGGNLALVLASSGTPGADRADVAVSVSGPTDFPYLATDPGIGMTYTYNHTWIKCGDPGSPSPCVIIYDVAKNYLYSLDLLGNEQLWQAASPYYLADATCSPCQIWNSQTELIPLSQATRFDQKLTSLGVSHELHIVSGYNHALAYWPTAMPSSLSFLHQHLG